MEEAKTPAPTESSSHGLPDIGDLFSESWLYLKKSLLHIFLFSVIGWVVTIGLVIAFVMILILSGVGIGSMFETGTVPNLAVLGPIITVAVIFGVVFVFLLIFTSIFTQIGTILSLKHAQDKTSFGELFSKSFKFILPVFVISLITGFLIGGAFFLFILPYLLFAFFFIFTVYVYVTSENIGLLDSLRRSMALVTSHFWGLLGRLILLFIIYFVIVVILQLLFKESVGGQLVSYVIQTLLGWFATAYIYVLFIHAQKSTDSRKMSSLLWPTIVAIVGYIVGVLIIIGLIALFAQLSKSGEFDKFKKELATEMSQESQVSSPADVFVESGNTKINEAISLSASDPNNTDQVVTLINEGINDLKRATTVDPDNYQAWISLGRAYALLNSAGFPESAQFSLDAYNKAVEVDPSQPDAFIALGGYYYQKEQYNTAITYFQKAAQVAPDDVNPWFNLGFAYREQGNTTQAKAAFQKALDNLPANSPDREVIEAEMNSL